MRKTRAHFAVIGRFTGGAPMPGKLTIERDAGLIAVRPHKRQKKYELPLNAVAEYIVWHCVKMELRDKKKQKKQERLARRRARKAG